MSNEMMKMMADKLGVSVEHLWNVLLTQAPISASIKMIIITVLIVCVAIGFKLIKHKTGEREWDTEISWMVWLVVCMVAIVMTITEIENIIAGFFNPEYWALMQLVGG